MTNDEIISLARSTIQNGRDLRDLVDVMNNADHECGLPLLVAYNLLRGHHAQVGIPDGPEHDGKLDVSMALMVASTLMHSYPQTVQRYGGASGIRWL